MYCNFMHFHILIEVMFDSTRLNHNKQVFYHSTHNFVINLYSNYNMM